MADTKTLYKMMRAMETAERGKQLLEATRDDLEDITGDIGDAMCEMLYGEPTDQNVTDFLKVAHTDKSTMWKVAQLLRQAKKAKFPAPKFLTDAEKATAHIGYEFIEKPSRTSPDGHEAERTIERLRQTLEAREKELHECADQLCQKCERYSCNECRWSQARRGIFE